MTTAAVVAAVVVCWAVLLPPQPLSSGGSPDPDLQRRTLAGAIHVHSNESDGVATPAGIAAAAARAGLQFVVFTDHGDATRQPEAPRYASGVLCIDAVEISTDGGHYVALGLPRAPYRLGGDSVGVAEDVRRLGGFGIVAHPDSPRPALAWHDWRVEADGVEWLNADSAWRSRSRMSLGRTFLGYLVRPGASLAALLDRPVDTIGRWDATTTRRRMPAFAAHDAHGGLGGTADDGGRVSLLSVPSYEASFRSLATRAVLRSRPTGTASEDAALLLEALREGRSYTTIDGLAAPGWLEFRGHREGHQAEMGEPIAGAGPVRLIAHAPILAGSTIALLRNGAVVSEGHGGEVSVVTSEPGAYRVEVRLDARPAVAPWILGNPIYVDLPPRPPAIPVAIEAGPLVTGPWRTEHDPSSSATVEAEAGRPAMSFHIGQGGSAFAALVAPLPHPPAFDAVLVDLTSASPARISLQFRSADGSARWRQSVYVSPGGGPLVLRTRDLAPAEKGGPPFDPAAADSVLLVVDLVNATHGAAGRIVVRELELARVR